MDDVEPAERHGALLAERVVDGRPSHLHGARARVRNRALDVQILGPAVELFVPASLSLEHERERRVLVDENPRQRIHHVQKAEDARHAARTLPHGDDR